MIADVEKKEQTAATVEKKKEEIAIKKLNTTKGWISSVS